MDRLQFEHMALGKLSNVALSERDRELIRMCASLAELEIREERKRLCAEFVNDIDGIMRGADA